MATLHFHTDRETKARYAWLVYRPILKGRILDAGADECYLKHDLVHGYRDLDRPTWSISPAIA